MANSCYVHVPFCESICAYCDFARVIKQDKLVDAWLNMINKEIKQANINRLSTLYFGGGTPSCLDINKFEMIISSLPHADECTIECNPDSIDRDKLIRYHQLGVNRISLGVQSFNDHMLKRCYRKHDRNKAIESIEMIKHSPIDNFSIDLIFGLPGQTLDDLKADIELFLELDIPHLSIYSLQIEPRSIFGRQKLEPCDEDLEADMYEYIEHTLKKAGYLHYEISSFCKDDKYSRHNLAYWSDQDFYGIGCGASGRIDGVRYDNTRDLAKYISDGPCPTYYDEDIHDLAYEALMMGLRTVFGLNINEFESKYQLKLSRYSEVIDKYRDYFIIDDRIRLNEAGMEILNSILVDFMMIW